MKKVNVAIIGYGLSGRFFHSPIIGSLEEFKICKIVTSDSTKKKMALDENEGVVVVDNVNEVFKDDSIDLIVISTPNTSHFELAKEAMYSGKHVLVEKPFTVTSDEASKLIEISHESGKILSVYQNRRFDGDYKTVKKIIDQGTLGRLVEFESHFDRFRSEFKVNSWREDDLPGSGILYDLGSHLIDQAIDLFDVPDEVYADIRSQRKGKVNDNFEIILYYSDLKVTLKAGSLVKEKLPRFILQGTKGAYVKFGLDIQEEDLRSGKTPKNHNWGEDPVEFWGTLNTSYDRKKIQSEKGDYRDYYINIYNAIVNKETLIVRSEDSLNVIKIIEAAIKSNEEKRRIKITI